MKINKKCIGKNCLNVYNEFIGLLTAIYDFFMRRSTQGKPPNLHGLIMMHESTVATLCGVCID